MTALRWWLFKKLSALGWWICPEPHKSRLLRVMPSWDGMPNECANEQLIRELRASAERRALTSGPFTKQNLCEWRAADFIAKLAKETK